VPTPRPAPSATADLFVDPGAPAWFDKAVLYEVYVRSFADSDGDGVGDLAGLETKLDYLEDLGADVLWLMPIYASPSDHGYDVTDLTHVNPDYGTLADLQSLVAAVHARGMKILLDFVPSHLSDEHPIFQDAFGNPGSPYSSWFAWTNDRHTTYAGFADSRDLPRLNHYDPAVVQFLTDAALFWLDLDGDGVLTDGVDGFRVDNATFPPTEFFAALRRAVKQFNPDALLLGEAWLSDPADLSRYFAGQFDALFDFPMYQILEGEPTFHGDGLLAGRIPPVLLTQLLGEEARRFPPHAQPVRFLNNHDTDRIASEVGSDPARLRLAAAWLGALPGPVMLYYGEEIGMAGSKGGPPDYDNYRRAPMDWYAAEQGSGQTTWFRPEDSSNRPADGVSVEEEDRDPNSLLNYYRRVLQIRRELPALQGLEWTIVPVDSSGTGVWVLRRQGGGEDVVMIFNFSAEARTITIAWDDLPGPSLVDLISGDSVEAASGDGLVLALPPAAAFYLAASEGP
jgi:glycosidase